MDTGWIPDRAVLYVRVGAVSSHRPVSVLVDSGEAPWQLIPVEGSLFILPFSSPLIDRRDPKCDGGGGPSAFANRGQQGRANWR